MGMFIGYLAWVLIRSVFLYLTQRYNVTKNISYREMENIFSIWGTEKQAQYFLSIIPKCYSPVISGNSIRYIKNRESVRIIFNYKFSSTSREDISIIYREKSPDSKIYILGRAPSRDVIMLTNVLPLDIIFIPSKRIRKILIKHNAMPDPIDSKNKKRLSWKKTFSETFSSEHIKYYYLGSLTFFMYGIFNIYRTWYFAFALTTFVFGCVSLLCSIHEKRESKKKKHS